MRSIFQRYLELGCVRALRDDLERRGIRPKRWTSSTGIARGGHAFQRGGLYHLLRNRLYQGEVLYKGIAYPGANNDTGDVSQPRLFQLQRKFS